MLYIVCMLKNVRINKKNTFRFFLYSLCISYYWSKFFMKTIAISLQKGGTGKTSIAVSLAAEIAQKTGSAIVVDLDPQGSATAWIGPETLDAETANVLFKQKTVKDVLSKTNFDGLFIMPTAGVGGQLKLYAETKALQQHNCIRNLLRDIAATGQRYCILDLSPGFGALERAAVAAADEVITPVMGDFFSIDGLEIFAANLKQLREDTDCQTKYNKIVINSMDERIPQHKQNQAIIENSKLNIYTIPVDPAFRKAQAARCTIQQFKAKPTTIAELSRLATTIIKEK